MRFVTLPKVRRLTRDGVLFIVGLAGIVNEATRHGTERPFLLMIFAGMVGLPAFIPKDPPPPPDKQP
jgi:hypothetical protein